MSTDTGIKIEKQQTLNAPVEHVFNVLTQGEHIPNWYGPSDDYKVAVKEWDCKVGGKYRVEFNTPAGDRHVVVGEFKELVPNSKVAYSWSWADQPPMDTLVTFELKPDGDKTALTFSHVGFPMEDIRDHHNEGWTGSLERLGRAVR